MVFLPLSAPLWGKTMAQATSSGQKKGYWTSLITIVGWGIISSLLLIFCAAPIFRIFIPQESVLPLGVDYLVILGVSQMPMCVGIITAGAFAGFGHTLPPSLASTLLVTSRIPLAMVLSRTALGLNGIWWSISHHQYSPGGCAVCSDSDLFPPYGQKEGKEPFPFPISRKKTGTISRSSLFFF